ncbi:MAG TPA: transporter [Sphingomicrobium sp.]
MRGLGYGCAAIILCASGVAVAADVQPICPDRPGKGTGTCTVPAGQVQVETDLIDWTRDESGGARSDLTIIGGSLLKYGISDTVDVELGVTPLELSRVRGPGRSERVSGFGDTLVRSKVRLTADDVPVQVALDPFVKIPTAKHGLGDGKVEGGLTVPVGVALGKGPLSLAFAPELDWHADSDGSGHHAAMIQLVDLGVSASSRLSLTAELWGQWDWDQAGTVKQYSADGALAYLLNNDLELDAGANFGLNRNTPDLELYTGVSKRF